MCLVLQREKEQKNTSARLQKLAGDVQELQSTNAELQEAADAAKAEAAAAKAEAAAAKAEAAAAKAEAAAVKVTPAVGDLSVGDDDTEALESKASPKARAVESDTSLAKISTLQSKIDELQSLGAYSSTYLALLGY